MINHLKYILTFTILVIGLNLFAQTATVQYGKLEVKVIDGMTKKTLANAVVKLEGTKYLKTKNSDSTGLAVYDSLLTDIYNITITHPGYQKTKLEEVLIKSNIITIRTISVLHKSIILSDTPQPKILIKKDEPTQQYLNNKQIMRMPY
jgi:hypothetical protein